jgi:hypothetical protein
MLHTGIMAEDGPADMVSSDRRAVDLGKSTGYLLAVTQRLALENRRLADEVSALEKRLDARERGLRS